LTRAAACLRASGDIGEAADGAIAFSEPVAIVPRDFAAGSSGRSLFKGGIMLITPAFAQAAPATGGGDLLAGQFGMIIPLVLMFVIFYFLLIRPQQRRAKEHQDIIKNVRRGDTVVTSGGLVGRVTKAVDGDAEVEVEIAEGVRVKVVRSMISDVRAKGEPVKEKA
jgi:preprotein translocase subunit YajC